MNKVFKTLFTDECEFCFMGDSLIDDIYNESTSKVYEDPIKLSASVRNNFKKEEIPIGVTNVTCIITVPALQMINNNLIASNEATLEEIEKLRKGIFRYKGITYLVNYVSMQTHIGDSYQFYKFFCYIDKVGE